MGYNFWEIQCYVQDPGTSALIIVSAAGVAYGDGKNHYLSDFAGAGVYLLQENDSHALLKHFLLFFSHVFMEVRINAFIDV